MFDASAIPWVYEPHTFALEHDGEGKVTEAFTPDFFLPEVGMYIECTTCDRANIARKRRKVRKARQRHNLIITLHERDDFDRLFRRYRR